MRHLGVSFRLGRIAMHYNQAFYYIAELQTMNGTSVTDVNSM